MFYGWRVVAGMFVCQMFSVGFFTYSASILTSPVRESFGASLEEVMYSLTIGTLAGLIVMPVTGFLIDKYSVRHMVGVGLLLFASGLWAIANSTSIGVYVVCFGITMSVAMSLVGSLAASAVISRWFSKSRGRALGVSAAGTSVGGILVPIMLTWAIELWGWRAALEYLALFLVLVVLPFVFATVRGRPEDVGMTIEESASPVAGAHVDAPLTLPQIIKAPAFWVLGISLGLLFSAYSAVLANLNPYITHGGFSAQQASSAIMLLAATGLIGKLGFGFLADKINLRVGLWLAQGLALAACVIIALEPAYFGIMFAAILLGLAAGGMLPVWGALMAQIFGVSSYGRAMGMMSPIITLCVMPGYAVTGMIFDSTGSFSVAWWLCSGLIVAAMLLLAGLKAKAIGAD